MVKIINFSSNGKCLLENWKGKYFVQHFNEVPICSFKLSNCTITVNARNWISMFWNSYFAVVFLHFFFSPPKLWLVSFGPSSPFALVWKANFSNKNIWLWKKKPGITWMDLIGFFKVPLTPYKSIHCLHSVHSHLGKVWHAIIYQLYTKLNVQYLTLTSFKLHLIAKAVVLSFFKLLHSISSFDHVTWCYIS